jgi:translation elongation factor EF-Ts
VLVNLNSETDFVAKSDDFTLFLGNTLQILSKIDQDIDYERGSSHLDGLLNDSKFDQENTIEEARKLLSAKTKEKIEFGKATIINSR